MSRPVGWWRTGAVLIVVALAVDTAGPVAVAADASTAAPTDRPVPRHAPSRTLPLSIDGLLGWLTEVLDLQLGPAPLEPGVEPVPSPTAPVATVTYGIVDDAGVGPDRLGGFADHVATTLRDPRGWALDGTIRLVRGDRAADFRIHLATPPQIAAHDGCSPDWSCTVGDDVYINLDNWEHATAPWADAPLDRYRHYVVVHEVGHVIGLPHVECGQAHAAPQGAPAPVMDQQSIGVGACRVNVWPLASERRWARRLIVAGTPQYARF